MSERPDDEAMLRERARESLKKKREFRSHLLAYILVNSFLVVIWAVTSAPGFFWPIFPIGGWGIGLAFHAWDAYGDVGPSDEQIRREMDRLRKDGR